MLLLPAVLRGEAAQEVGRDVLLVSVDLVLGRESSSGSLTCAQPCLETRRPDSIGLEKSVQLRHVWQ